MAGVPHEILRVAVALPWVSIHVPLSIELQKS